MANTARKFPMDGYTDSCNGLGATVPVHGTDDEVVQGLCKACTAQLDAFAVKYPAPMSDRAVIAQRCICGKRGHEHGAKYSTCNCCFAD